MTLWHRLQARATVLVWTLLAVLLAVAASHRRVSGDRAVTLWFVLLLCASCAGGAILLARRLRGRTSAIDGLHAVIWLHPWQIPVLLSPAAPIALAAGALASAALIVLSCGWRSAREWLVAEVLSRIDQKAALLALFALLVWLARLQMPVQGRPSDNDNSWSVALGYFFTHGMQAGVDWLFTAGPLGIFHNMAYQPELFWTKVVVWELAFGLVAAVLLTRQWMRLSGALERCLFALAVLVLPRPNDTIVCITMLAVFAWMIERPVLARPAIPIGLVMLSAFGLGKFTLLTFVLGGVAVLTLYFWQSRTWRTALAFAGLYTLVQCSMWMLAGQSLWNVPIYLARSMEISSGYNEAMSFPAPDREALLGRSTLVIVALLAAIHFASAPRTPLRRAQGCLLLLSFFVMFKAGFTRGDHGFIFFGFAPVAPYLLCTPPPGAAWVRMCALIGRCACVVLGTLGLCQYPGFGERPVHQLTSWWIGRVTENVIALSDLRGWKADCDEKLAEMRRMFALPQVRAVVGQRPIDVINWEQSTLIVNGFNWKPRLTFQSYSAYTPKLVELNARSFEGDDALEYLLFRMQTIDSRLPTSDDGLALQWIARDYEPVLSEKGLVLFHRNPPADPGPPTETLIDRTLRFDETVDLRGLAGRCHVLSLDIEYTLWGRIRTWIDQAPALFMEVETATEKRRYRIVSGMMKTGAILNPLIDNDEQWQAWFTGVELPRVLSLRVEPPTAPEMLVPHMRLRLVQADRLIPRDASQLRARLEYSMFDSWPISVKTPANASKIVLDGQEVLLVRTPSVMVFEVAPGKHVLTGKYGMLPRAYLEGTSDGATFSATLRTEDGESSRVLFKDFIDPRRVQADRGLLDMQVSFENSSPAHLLVRTSPGPKQDPTHDLALWSAIRISD